MTDNTTNADKLLTDKEAAKFLAVSRTSVWNYVKRGLIPQPIKIGGLARWPLSDIQNVIEAAKLQRAA